jgi:hypothetical protein
MTVKDGKEAKMETLTGTIGNEVPYKESSSQHAFSQQAFDDFNKINTKCEENLRKVSEVKTERKRVNFKDREDRMKFQAVIPNEKNKKK